MAVYGRLGRRFPILGTMLGAGLLVFVLAGTAWARGGPSGGGVPEIDGGSAMSAVTLLAGGILWMTDRIRRNRSSR